MDERDLHPDDGRTNGRINVPIRIRYWNDDSGPAVDIEPTVARPASESAKGSDRRTAVRVPRAVEIEFWIDGTSQKGRIEDLSETGLFVSTTHFYEQGKEINFRFELPEDPDAEPIWGKGTVVWTEQVGFAIRFSQLDPDALERLRSFIETEVASGLALESAAL